LFEKFKDFLKKNSIIPQKIVGARSKDFLAPQADEDYLKHIDERLSDLANMPFSEIFVEKSCTENKELENKMQLHKALQGQI